jgi:hypothetical protein
MKPSAIRSVYRMDTTSSSPRPQRWVLVYERNKFLGTGMPDESLRQLTEKHAAFQRVVEVDGKTTGVGPKVSRKRQRVGATPSSRSAGAEEEGEGNRTKKKTRLGSEIGSVMGKYGFILPPGPHENLPERVDSALRHGSLRILRRLGHLSKTFAFFFRGCSLEAYVLGVSEQQWGSMQLARELSLEASSSQAQVRANQRL